MECCSDSLLFITSLVYRLENWSKQIHDLIRKRIFSLQKEKDFLVNYHNTVKKQPGATFLDNKYNRFCLVD